MVAEQGIGEKRILNGQQYDQVIDVELEDGTPPLKLGFNIDDSPQVCLCSLPVCSIGQQRHTVRIQFLFNS